MSAEWTIKVRRNGFLDYRATAKWGAYDDRTVSALTLRRALAKARRALPIKIEVDA